MRPHTSISYVKSTGTSQSLIVEATPTGSPVKVLLRFGEERSRVNVGLVEIVGAR